MEQFDFVTLTETFVDNSFDMPGVFCDHVKYVVLLSICLTKGDDREAL